MRTYSYQSNTQQFVINELNLKIREWDCPACHSNHLRDVNAAINIHRVGTSTLRGETVRLTRVS